MKLENPVVIINGSARHDGNSSKIAEIFISGEKWNHVILNNYQIGHYDYNHQNYGDDFFNIIDEAVLTADHIVFITPVYWYTMSGHMKVFFDRLSDLLQIEKEKGRQLRGKSMSVIACGSEETESKGFFEPFKQSADYLGINYVGECHSWVTDENISLEVQNRIQDFRLVIKNSIRNETG